MTSESSESIVNALARHRSAEPFGPFELVFQDGRRARVVWPDAVGWHAKDDQLSYAAEDDSFIHRKLSDLVDVQLVDNQRTRGSGTAA